MQWPCIGRACQTVSCSWTKTPSSTTQTSSPSSSTSRGLICGFTTTTATIFRPQARTGRATRLTLFGVNHQPSIINHQSSTINHQPSIINHQPSIINRDLFSTDQDKRSNCRPIVRSPRCCCASNGRFNKAFERHFEQSLVSFTGTLRSYRGRSTWKEREEFSSTFPSFITQTRSSSTPSIRSSFCPFFTAPFHPRRLPLIAVITPKYPFFRPSFLPSIPSTLKVRSRSFSPSLP